MATSIGTAEDNTMFVALWVESLGQHLRQRKVTYAQFVAELDLVRMGCRTCRNLGHPWNEACRV